MVKQVTSAGVVVYRILNKSLEYLLLHYVAGHWDFPKGKMEQGETKQETALRELQEEAGISAVLVPGFEESFSYSFCDYDGAMAQKTVYFYIGKAKSTLITLSHEHKDFAWLPYEEAYKKLTYTNAQMLLKKVNEYIHSLLELSVSSK